MQSLSKILLFSWQEQIQKEKYLNTTQKGIKVSSLGQEPTFNTIKSKPIIVRVTRVIAYFHQ